MLKAFQLRTIAANEQIEAALGIAVNIIPIWDCCQHHPERYGQAQDPQNFDEGSNRVG